MARRRGIFGIVWRVLAYTILASAVAFTGLLIAWSFAPPVSTLMMARTLTGRSYERQYVPFDAIAPVLVATVVTSEDGQFCKNRGVDWIELRTVIHDPDGPSRGASTITMQVARNLFLWPGRSVVRKAIEIPMALVLGLVWSKRHTLEVYLNVAEWGDGIFGIEAAARHYFHKSARQLDADEAALLATALPNPIKRDPSNPGVLQRRLAGRLAARTRDTGAKRVSCLQR